MTEKRFNYFTNAYFLPFLDMETHMLGTYVLDCHYFWVGIVWHLQTLLKVNVSFKLTE